ncbi:hypothetical protein BHM03_00036428 [Ensete ventricosum]|nr:hypothetical protein BHM03_00036428 [Ensete ventricosum]
MRQGKVVVVGSTSAAGNGCRCSFRDPRVHPNLGGGDGMQRHYHHLPHRRKIAALPGKGTTFEPTVPFPFLIIRLILFWADFQVLLKKKQDALNQALQKLKEELMLLGFISLLLTVFQSLISNICIPKSVSSYMLPCKVEKSTSMQEIYHGMGFYYGQQWNKRRLLSSGSSSGFCLSKGKVPLLSLEALHQLHIFIFVLAVVHVVFSASMMVLGGAKVSYM